MTKQSPPSSPFYKTSDSGSPIAPQVTVVIQQGTAEYPASVPQRSLAERQAEAKYKAEVYQQASIGIFGALIGFFIGVTFSFIGWIALFFIYRDYYDSGDMNNAKGVIVGAVASVVLSVLTVLLILGGGLALFGSLFSYF
ncbi:MAG: hypothetical protein Q4F00_09385 [bacterium]|nr:hypothetical protein [bacterium]